MSGHYTSDCRYNRHNKALSVSLFAVSMDDKLNFYIDSAATAHMSSNVKMYANITQCNGVATTENGSSMNICGRGSVTISPQCMNGKNLSIKEVEYIPELTTNLLSVSQAVKKGNIFIFDSNGGFIYDKNWELIVSAKQVNGLFQVSEIKSKAMNVSAEIWHKRMGHLNYRDLNELKQKHSEGITFCKKGFRQLT